MTELLALHGVVEAPPDRVADLLLDLGLGGRSPLGVFGEGDGFTVVQNGSRLTVTVDRAGRAVTQQGEWWFRGVHAVEADPRGSRVTYRIFNVAAGHGWAVRFVARGPLNAAPASFASLLREIGERLGVAAGVEG